MDLWKKVIFGSVMFGAGLGLGFTASLIIMLTDEPAIVIEEKWRTITTAPAEPIVLGHTSLNEDELRNLLKIQAEEGITSTTVTTLPVTSTTIRPLPTTVVTLPTTQPSQPPSTLPNSSTTLPTLPPTTTTMAPTTTVTTSPPTTVTTETTTTTNP